MTELTPPQPAQNDKTSSDYIQRRYLAWQDAMEMKSKLGRVKWKEIYQNYNIAESSLSRYVRNGTKPSTRVQQNKSRAKLNENDDGLLQKWILDQNLYGRYPTTGEIYNLANYLYRRKSTRDVSDNLVKKSWGRSWLGRYKHFKVESLAAIHKALLDGYCYENCKQYFDQLKDIIAQIDPDLIYNFEQTGFNVGDLSTLRGREVSHPVNRYQLQSQGQGWITIFETIRSNGTAIKPFIVVKGEEDKVISNERYSLTYTTSGWANQSTLLSFLKEHFDPITQQHAGSRHRLIIFNGNNQCDEAFFQYCNENKIIAIQLPPNANWCLQPLDVGIFGAHKQTILQAEDDWFNFNQQQVLSKSQFVNLILENRLKVMTQETISSSFRLTGIYPFDEEFLDRIPQRGRADKPLQETLIRMTNEWIMRVMEFRPDEEEAIRNIAARRFSVVTGNASHGRMFNYFNNNSNEQSDEDSDENEDDEGENFEPNADATLQPPGESPLLTGVKIYHHLSTTKLDDLHNRLINVDNSMSRIVSENEAIVARNKELEKTLNKETVKRTELEKNAGDLFREVTMLKQNKKGQR